MASIQAILFDMGGTLVYPARKKALSHRLYLDYLVDLLGVEQDPASFCDLLRQRNRAYKRWAVSHARELSEEQIWTRWLLPDWPAEKISRLAPQLNYWWRAARGVNQVPRDMQSTLIELARRGYRLGLVSNTTSRSEGFAVLESQGLLPYFDTLILSTVCGIRKPDPAIFALALSELGLSPDQVAYVGDRPERDVLGARRAGIARTVVIRLTEPLELPPASSELTPDDLVHSLSQLLDLFPARANGEPAHA